MDIPQEKLIDGRAVARRTLEECKQAVARIAEQTDTPPCLATVLVGDSKASATYVRMKQKRCADVGIRSVAVELPAGITTEEMLEHVGKLADDPTVHGILIQHPVPPPVDKRAAFEAIPAAKDVDGVTSASLGRMMLNMPGFASCTPGGIMKLLDAYDVQLEGKQATVIGRSPILGKPMAALLLNAHATVTTCHSRTDPADLAAATIAADIVVAAVGIPKYVQGHWVKRGAVVIDAGYNAGNVGDVDFDAIAPRASLITPVPGGVGPMTIATLMYQTVQAAIAQMGLTVEGFGV